MPLPPPAASDLRILLWFSHFSVDGMAAFKYGAFALAHYCLAHRGEVRLTWPGSDVCLPTLSCHATACMALCTGISSWVLVT